MIYTARDIAPRTLPTFVNWKLKRKDLYFDCDKWFEDIIESRDVRFDCITYTASPEYMDKCETIICTKLRPGRVPCYVKLHLFDNIHTKLFLVRGKRIDEVWMGSMNLGSTTSWHNIMMKVCEPNKTSLKLYFEKLLLLCKFHEKDSE